MGRFAEAVLIGCVTIIVGIVACSAQSFGAEASAAQTAPLDKALAAETGTLPPSATAPVAPAPAANAPVISLPASEKEQDLVLAPGDLDSRVSEAREAEAEDGIAGDPFFADAVEEIGKGENGLYAGLTARIDKNVAYFQGRGRERFEVWLSRSGKYSGMMREILEKYGLPGDLIYLALIESGFSPKAYSRARASGPWQFIRGTARRYGLRVDWWIDERRDYEKSTHAAASYLRDLYGMFDSWPLAAAAYNAGEGKIQRAVARYKTEDFAELIRYRYLKHETKDYVPKMLAALSIAKEPEKYGFDNVMYEEPIAFDRVIVPGATDLAAMEGILELPEETLREYNPEIRRFCTPPTQAEYEIRIPKGFAPIAADRMDQIRSEAKVTFLLHTVKKGETLASIAEKCGTPEPVLREMNGLKRRGVKRNARLVVPVTGLTDEEAIPGKEVSPAQLTMAHMRVEEGIRRGRGRAKGRTVRVYRGDTLTRIAADVGVSVGALARANGMSVNAILKAGTRLRVPRAVAPRPVRTPRQSASGGDGAKPSRSLAMKESAR
ncbi:MAG: transglycosylase SLT domain-containing protein [Gemmatimonadota bacterium]